jgi:hypothetical protein
MDSLFPLLPRVQRIAHSAEAFAISSTWKRRFTGAVHRRLFRPPLRQPAIPPIVSQNGQQRPSVTKAEVEYCSREWRIHHFSFVEDKQLLASHKIPNVYSPSPVARCQASTIGRVRYGSWVGLVPQQRTLVSAIGQRP